MRSEFLLPLSKEADKYTVGASGPTRGTQDLVLYGQQGVHISLDS
jgi:hypothetical protein